MPISFPTIPACGTLAMTKPVLLDTCALLWLASSPERISAEMMVNAALLPLHHRDPADRFIIATALKMNLPVVTSDDNFPKYGVATLI